MLMNLHIVLIAATMLAAAFIFSIGLHILAKSGIVRKKYFLLLINSIFIILLGHMIELTAGGTDSAFSGVRLLYFGGALTSMFLVFFIADYFGIKLHAAVRAFLVVLAAVYILAAWTTDKTGFLYASMEYDPVYTHYLLYAPGPLGLASRAAPMFYAAVSTVLLLRSLRGMRGKRRAVPVIMLAVVFLPCASEIIFYALSVLGYARISLYLTPHILTGVVFLMYYGIIRYDIDAEAVAAVVAMDTISEPFILLDGNFCCLSFNKAAGAFFPWITALPGDEPVLSHPGWPRELPASVFSGGNRSVNFSSADGLRLFSAGVNPANTVSARRVGTGGGKRLWSILIRDVTESENFVKRLEEAAYIDTLTGLYNRRHFSEIAAPIIERARRAGTPYYFMMVDIDDFKDVNDVHGHLAGDAVLRGVAQTMKRTVRPYDILARWGGEEFILIITDIDEPGVLNLSERIRREVEAYACEYMGKVIGVTISAGLAQSADECDITELTLRADKALYTAKTGGKNSVVMWTPQRSRESI